MINYLNAEEKRTITACNFNLHIHSAHPDRVMEEHDLIYIREGSWSICQEGSRFDLVPGDVILLQAGCRHFGPEPCQGSVKTIFVHFSRSAGDGLLEPGAEGRAEEERMEGKAGYFFPVKVSCRDNPMVEHYFRQLHSAYWSEAPFSDRRAGAWLDLLLCELSRPKEADRPDPMIVEALRLLKETPGRFFTVQELAGRFGFSERAFASRFRAAVGETVHRYQMELKCQMAKELMACNPRLTLREVASTFGFYDEYHFSKCFKKRFGHSPKAYGRNSGGKDKEHS